MARNCCCTSVFSVGWLRHRLSLEMTQQCTLVRIASHFAFACLQMSGRQAQQTTQGQVGTARTETTTSEKSGGGGGGLGGLVRDLFQLSCFGEVLYM